jgi:hypothetical protein
VGNTPDGPVKITRHQRLVPSTEVLKQLEDTLPRAAKAAFARTPSAATTMEEMQEASPRAAAPVSVAAAEPEAVVGGDDRYGEMPHAANESEHRQMVFSDDS